MISIYGEMFPGFASAGGDNCMLARAGAANLQGARIMFQLFLADALLALGIILVPYSIEAARIWVAEWHVRPLSAISRSSAMAAAAIQIVALLAVSFLTFKGIDITLKAVGGETYMTLMDARQTFETECNTVRQQP